MTAATTTAVSFPFWTVEHGVATHDLLLHPALRRQPYPLWAAVTLAGRSFFSSIADAFSVLSVSGAATRGGAEASHHQQTQHCAALQAQAGHINGLVLKQQKQEQRVGVMFLEASSGLADLHGSPAEVIALASAFHVPGVVVFNTVGTHPMDILRLLRDAVALAEFTAPMDFTSSSETNENHLKRKRVVFPAHLVLLGAATAAVDQDSTKHMKQVSQRMFEDFFSSEPVPDMSTIPPHTDQQPSAPQVRNDARQRILDAFLSVTFECVDVSAFVAGGGGGHYLQSVKQSSSSTTVNPNAKATRIESSLSELIARTVMRAVDVRFSTGGVKGGGGGAATLSHALGYASRLEKRMRQVVSPPGCFLHHLTPLHGRARNNQQPATIGTCDESSDEEESSDDSDSLHGSSRDGQHGHGEDEHTGDDEQRRNEKKSMKQQRSAALMTQSIDVFLDDDQYYQSNISELGENNTTSRSSVRSYDEWMFNIASRTLEEDFCRWCEGFFGQLFSSAGANRSDHGRMRNLSDTTHGSGNSPPTVVEVEERFGLVLSRVRALLSLASGKREATLKRNGSPNTVRASEGIPYVDTLREERNTKLIQGADTMLAVAVAAVKRHAAQQEVERQRRLAHGGGNTAEGNVNYRDAEAGRNDIYQALMPSFNSREIPPALHGLAERYPRYRFWFSFTGIKFLSVGALVLISSLYLQFFS